MAKVMQVFETSDSGTEYPAKFAGLKVNVPLPGFGDSEEPLTIEGKAASHIRAILEQEGWTEGSPVDPAASERALNKYTSADRLARQKRIKALLGSKDYKEYDLAAEGAAEELVAKLQETAEDVADLKVREMYPSEDRGKPRPATVEKVKKSIVAEAQAKLANMSDEERAEAQAVLERLGLA